LPKTKFPDATALENFIDCMETQVENGKNTNLLRYNTTSADSIINEPLFQPTYFTGFTSVWKYEHKEIILEPGVSHVFYIKGPKNVELDFNKLWEGPNDKVGSLTKMSVSCFYQIKPDLEYATAGVNGATGVGSGRWLPTGIAGLPDFPVSLEVTETFKIACPDSSGFITQAAVAGNPQAINFKRPQIAVGNFTDPETYASNVYAVLSEENPELRVTGSQFQ